MKSPFMEIFRKPTPRDHSWIHDLAARPNLRSADFSFCNIYCRERSIDSYVGRMGDRLLVKTCVRSRPMYLYPAGSGDIMPALEALAEDAKHCGHRYVLRGVTREVLPEMMTLFPIPPEITLDEGCSDYVYLASDLAALSGKRYHSKKNHVNRFSAGHEWSFEPITRHNIDLCRDMAERRFAHIGSERVGDHAGEAEALRRALGIYFDVGLDGGIIIADGEPAAFTIGEMISPDTLDTHFEMADPRITGAYPVINQQFAKYMLAKHPGLAYINREADMGIDGLRQAKQSYRPAFMVDKFTVEWKI